MIKNLYYDGRNLTLAAAQVTRAVKDIIEEEGIAPNVCWFAPKDGAAYAHLDTFASGKHIECVLRVYKPLTQDYFEDALDPEEGVDVVTMLSCTIEGELWLAQLKMGLVGFVNSQPRSGSVRVDFEGGLSLDVPPSCLSEA